ncbi:hypothetical protein DV113_002268 [Geotrichum candidum]|uniref:HECT-type E3 ubiquitin transferase n=1 Tax=Geotrichum candidum TaxID=1173061 RepID=A0A0J9X2R9_GEOCN|nr:hypothetical protein DV454_005150 [Geotrichum candidum]KAF5114184.1 hypothetical protein DV452_003420 [Geotrichum candidum]KAF7499682.1 hypothetical protein DV113_002268 [Geotrichum candidum]CDO51387.1 similar to Saccharomyces cerevisiae YJR036C HUL4 Protein with similarity to hect domain E3 ubiquitin-protein ligases [Geotrichum candidum]
MLSPSLAPQLVSKSYTRTARLIARYLYQILVGCGNPACTRTYCKSSKFQTAFGNKSLRKQAVVSLAMEIASLRGDTQLCRGYELDNELPAETAQLIDERDPLRSPVLIKDPPPTRPIAAFWKKGSSLTEMLPDELQTTLPDLEAHFSKIKSELLHDRNIFSVRSLVNLLNGFVTSIERGRSAVTDSSMVRDFLTRIVETTDMSVWRFLNIQLEPKTPSVDTLYPRVLAIKTLQSWAPNSKSAPHSFHSRVKHIVRNPRTKILDYKYYHFEVLPRHKLPPSALDVFTPNWALVKTNFSPEHDAPLEAFFNLPTLVSFEDRVTMVRYLCFRRMETAAKQVDLVAQTTCMIADMAEPDEDAVFKITSRRSTPNLYRTFMLRLPRLDMTAKAMGLLSKIPNWEVLFMPLKIEFDGGEIGVDVGGVQVEFFDQVGREFMTPELSLMEYDEESNVPWINDQFTSHAWKYVGVIFGLAIHNGCTLPVDLPPVFYKLIVLGTRSGEFSIDNFRPHDITLEDFAQAFPTTARSLRNLKRLSRKDFKVVDLKFICTFYSPTIRNDYNIKLPSFGKYPNNAVTIDNVDIYIREYMIARLCLTNEKFVHFCTSLNFFLPFRALHAFRPLELKYFIEGQPLKGQFVKVLRKLATYDVYDRDSPTVRMFWQLLETRFGLEEIKRLVMFVTGTDRLPVGDLRAFDFVISKLGEGPEAANLIPTASVCTSRLLLPEYQSLAQMETKLRLALENATGFGLG